MLAPHLMHFERTVVLLTPESFIAKLLSDGNATISSLVCQLSLDNMASMPLMTLVVLCLKVGNLTSPRVKDALESFASASSSAQENP